jgi:outer membrane protein TolC
VAIIIPWTVKAQDKSAVLNLTLDKAIQIALSENPTVRIAEVEIQKKKYARKTLQASLYPQIDAIGQYSRTLKKQVMYMDNVFNIGEMLSPIMEPLVKGTEQTMAETVPGYRPGQLSQNIIANTPPPPESTGDNGIAIGRSNNWTGGFNMTWPVVVPSLWKTLDITSLDIEFAVENARTSKINMVNAVRKSYYGVLLAGEAVRMYSENFDNAMLIFNNINNKFNQGLVSEFDLIRADVNAKNIKPNLIQAENAYSLSSLSLKALMGIDMNQEIVVTGNLFEYEMRLYSYLTNVDTTLNNNSDLKKFDIQGDQLKKTLEIYKAQYLPTIAVTGNYIYMSMNNNFRFGDYHWNPYSTIGLSVSIPIFDGFRKTNEIRQTKASMLQMEWQREDIVRNLKLAINNNLNNMTNYVEQIFSTKDVFEQARKGYEISQKLYDTGMGTLLDVNSAQLGMMQAGLAFTQAIYNFLTSKADLDKVLGVEIE